MDLRVLHPFLRVQTLQINPSPHPRVNKETSSWGGRSRRIGRWRRYDFVNVIEAPTRIRWRESRVAGLARHRPLRNALRPPIDDFISAL